MVYFDERRFIIVWAKKNLALPGGDFNFGVGKNKRDASVVACDDLLSADFAPKKRSTYGR